jgi:hypothetical protein
LGSSGVILAGLGCQSASLHDDKKSADATTKLEEPFGPRAIVDCHIHVVPGNINLKPLPEKMQSLMTFSAEAKAERLRQEMSKAGVRMAFAMGETKSPPNDPLGVKGTLEVAAFVPGLRAIGIMDPTQATSEHLQAVERQIEQQRGQIVALKGYLGYQHFGPEAPEYKPYYALAQKYKLPVFFHTGDTWSTTAKVKYAHPLRLDEVAVDWPQVQFVMAHFGNPWFNDAAEVLYKNDNVWADLSGLAVGDESSFPELKVEKNGPKIPGVLVEQLRAALGYAEQYDRLLYGSDWPLASMHLYRRSIEAIISAEHHEKVFWKNSKRLFNI